MRKEGIFVNFFRPQYLWAFYLKSGSSKQNTLNLPDVKGGGGGEDA